MSRILGLSDEEDFQLSRVELTGTPEDIAMEMLKLSVPSTEESIDGMRASSLYYTCPRMVVLAHKHEKTATSKLSIGERLTYGIGHAVHYWLQNNPDFFGDNRIGFWRCRACSDIARFGPPITTDCKVCGAHHHAFEYFEAEVVTDDPYPCSGHIDLFIKKEGKLRILDVKTIAADGFKGLIHPKVEHVWQLQYYMWASSLTNIESDPNVGYVLYVSKGMLWKTLPFKAFVVKKNERILDEIRERLFSVYDGISNGILPPTLSECEKYDFSRGSALNCPVARECESELFG